MIDWEEADRVARTVKFAATYLRKATDLGLQYRPVSSDFWTLLDRALESSLDIVRALPDDFFAGYTATSLLDGQPFKNNLSDGPLEAAERLVQAIKDRREREDVRRKIAALEDTTGRTPEEAASYEAAARSLRERHGIEA